MAREYDLGEKSSIGISGAYGTIRTPAYDKMKRAEDRRNREFEEAYASPEFKRFLAELVQREDSKPIIYRDKNGILHGGTGHKLTPEEKKQYNEGDPVTQEQIDTWFEEDSRKAWAGAMDKADDIDNKALLPYLAHVDYQLGSNWHKDFEKTYRFLKEGDYASARDEVQKNSAGTGPSKWFADTPGRVRDFQKGLETTGGFSPADQRPEQFWDYKGQQHSYEVDPEKELAFTKVHYQDPKDYWKGSYLKDQLQSSTVQVTGGDKRRIWPNYQRDIDKETTFKTIGKRYPYTVPGTVHRAEQVGGQVVNATIGALQDFTAPGWALKISANMKARKRRREARRKQQVEDTAEYGSNRFK